MLKDGYDPADCIVQGMRIIEDDPENDSVGLGGQPNEERVVELDASVMYGPTHKSGAVAGTRNIKNPAMVALEVLRRTNHCLLVGEGALKFAKRMGFGQENLLTEKSRLEWLMWRAELSKEDDWLNADQQDATLGKHWQELGLAKPLAEVDARGVQYRTGTVHCSIVTPKGDIASCTSTSGLSWKIPGRVGDSPIIGAGNTATTPSVPPAAPDVANRHRQPRGLRHRAEDGRGMSPTEAALTVARRVADHGVLEKRHKNASARPDFNAKF